jgi:hypothetical protein
MIQVLFAIVFSGGQIGSPVSANPFRANAMRSQSDGHYPRSIARKKPLIAQRLCKPNVNRRSSGPPANYAKPPASTHLSH